MRIKRYILAILFLSSLPLCGAQKAQPGENSAAVDPCQQVVKEISSFPDITAYLPIPTNKTSTWLTGTKKEAIPVVLVHGLLGSKYTFGSLAAQLGGDRQVLSYDQRGHGETPALGYCYSPECLAEDLKNLILSQGWKKVHLYGFSLGAKTVVAFALKYPEMVASLVIEDMHLSRREFDSRGAMLDYALEVEKRGNWEFASREEAASWLTPYLGEEMATSIVHGNCLDLQSGRVKLTIDPGVTMLYSSQSNVVDFGDSLSKITVPVLLLQADPKRSAVTSHGLAVMKKNLPNLKVVPFEGGGHYLHREMPDTVSAAVRPFLGENDSISSTP